MSAIHIFTDPTHSMAKAEVFPSLYMPGAHNLIISDKKYSNFLGFGVAITPSSCYELSLMEPSERRKLLRHIYGKDGIGLSVGRICVGSSDYSPEIYSYDDHPFDTELKHFSVARDEKYIIPIIKEIVEINPDIYLFASPWSPPYWMKTGESMCGGYMRDKYVDYYADYFIKFIEAYAEYGIKISAVTPQNEPETQQSGHMPACIWHPETEAEFIRILREKLNAKGMDIKIWMYDHSFIGAQRVIWSLKNCEGLKSNCDAVAFHYYNGFVDQTAEVTREFPELDLHFTEGGPRLTDHYDTDWCKWGLMIIRTLKYGYKSFTGWNLMLNERGGPNVGPFIGICAGLVTHNETSGELSYSGQYKAYSHIAPYITPESKISYIETDSSFGQNMSSYPRYEHKIEGILIDNGTKVAVLINQNNHGIQAQIKIDGRLWYSELPADSISTIIFEK